jgi:hypothetical protein
LYIFEPSLYFMQALYKFFFVLLIVLGNYEFSNAQGATIKGFVFDKETEEPIIFTNIVLEGTTIGVATDVNGYFALTKIPAGTYTIVVSFLGYEKYTEEITLSADETVTKKLFVKKSSIQLKEISVSAERMEAKNDVKMSVTKLTPKEMSKVPTVGGDPDLAQVLTVQPGVIFTGDQGGQLYIRGGSPIQNKVLLDGMIIYNPFHSIGLFSVFDTDIMRNADIYTGGFNAQYGGRISSIMDITTRDGNKNHLAGKVSASTFGAKVLLEGPLMKPKTLGGGGISYVLSYKNSYLDRSSKAVYDYIDQDLPFRYSDLYGKVSMSAKGGSKLNMFGFNFTDDATFQSISDISWDASGGGTNFLLIPGQSNVLIEGVISYSQYEISLDDSKGGTERPDNNRSSAINGFNMGMDFTSFQGKNQSKYGFEILGFGTKFSFTNSVNQKIEQNENTTELAGYYLYKLNTGKLVLEPSLRFHYYSSLDAFSPEPRLGAKYNVSDRFRLKFASGMYAQNLISANSDRDVVNLFSGFLSGPENLQTTFVDEEGNVKDVKHKLQKAIHVILGFELDMGQHFTVNVEGYLKRFRQLTNINRNKIFDEDDSEFDDEPEVLKKDFIIETGNAYGVDFVLKYTYNQFSFWSVYSLSKVDRWDGIQTYAPVFDRRHNVNLLASYTFGKSLSWEAGLRWNYGSGFPFTQTRGFYEKVDFGSLGDDYTSVNGELGVLFGEINGGRLPEYHRLDASLKRKFVLGENSILEASASVTNTYDRNNIFYFDRVSYQRVNQLPIMPSFGLSLTF